MRISLLTCLRKCVNLRVVYYSPNPIEYDLDSGAHSTYSLQYHLILKRTHIRTEIPEASWQHVWSFRCLYEYVEYNAEAHGAEVVQVDSRNTSNRCSTCGCTHPDNRHGERLFANSVTMRITPITSQRRCRLAVSPSPAKCRLRRRTCRRALKSRDAEREWEYNPLATS